MIDPELLHMLIDQAIDEGHDEHRSRHFRVLGEAPQPILHDLRFAGRSEFVSAWQSPRYRALLLASEEAGRLVAFADEARFRQSVRLARQGILPEPPLRQR